MDVLNKLTNLLGQFQVEYEIIHHPVVLKTPEEAGQYLEVSKWICVRILDTEDGLIALVISWERRNTDLRQLKEQLGYERMEPAEGDDVFYKTGYKTDAVPLIVFDLPCIMEEKLLELDFIYGPTDDSYHTLKISPADVQQLNHIIAVF